MKDNKCLFLLFLICFSSIRVCSQKNDKDSLLALLKPESVKQMSFNQLYKIQVDNQNLPKELAIGFSEALINRQDLMATDSFKCKAYLQAGSMYSKYGDFTKAEKLLSQSLSIALKREYKPLLVPIYNALGLYYARNNKDSLAIEQYTKSISTAEQLNETKEVSKTYVNITSLFLKRALLDKCISYGLTGLPIAEKSNNLRPLAGISINIGTAYFRKKDYSPAITFFRKSIDASSRIQDNEKMISAFANLCNVYTILNNKDSATLYAGETAALLQKMNSPNELVQSNSVLAKYHVTYGNYNEAIKFADKALEVSKKTGIVSLNGQDAYLALYQAYKALNNKDSALSALEQYWALNEPRLLNEKDKAMLAVEQQFQQYKKENEINLLKKDKAIGVTQRNSAVLVALLLAIAAFLFYNRFRIKKRSTDSLTRKNLEIEKQKALIQASLGEKETLLREIHHRVKNNLQIISSLLNIQSEHIRDEQVLSSIQEGQSRVQAMSLIHQNLYQSEHLNNVDITNYLQQLVDYLANVYAHKDKSIIVKIDAAQASFDIDTAIPLGLIVNELVSNAFKYAFPGADKGHISINIRSVNDINYELTVEDDGVGLPAGFDPEKTNSLGLKLVKILSRQLRGSFSSKPGKGSVFLVTFKDLRAYRTT